MKNRVMRRVSAATRRARSRRQDHARRAKATLEPRATTSSKHYVDPSHRPIVTKLVQRVEARRLSEAVDKIGVHLRNDSHDADAGGCDDNFDSSAVDTCMLPGRDAQPQDEIWFHQRLSVQNLASLEGVTIACASLDRVSLSFGFVQQYRQSWEYRGLTMGRPVAHVALAPLERRRLQVAYKRKTNLARTDRMKRTSRLSYDASSSTKASTSATNSSVSRNKWSVSASASYGLGGVGWGGQVEGSIEGSAEQTRQRAVENVAEETQKSATEISSESETTTTIGLQTSFEQIEERQLVNPYADRSLLISLSSLISTHCVSTKTDRMFPCLIFDFDPVSSIERRSGPSINFDEGFVSVHRHFLRTTLIDQSLIDYLEAMDSMDAQVVDTGEISSSALRCLNFLFEDDYIFATPFFIQFDIEDAFDMTLEGSVLNDAQDNDLTDYYFLMTSARYLWRRDRTEYGAGAIDAVEYGRRSIEYVLMLHSGLSDWPAATAETKFAMYRGASLAEQFRRIGSFLELTEQLVLEPLGRHGPVRSGASTQDTPATGEDSSPQDGAGTSTGPRADNPRLSPQARIVNHLNCFGRFYTEEFLHFLHEWTGVSPVIELMAGLEESAYRALLNYLDFERSFIDGTCWIVPFASGLEAQTAASAFMDTTVDFSKLSEPVVSKTVRMPAEGLHIEAVPGECVLPDLPTSSHEWLPAMPVRIEGDLFPQPPEDL